MSKCDILITLDNASRTFRGGEAARGKVIVHVHETFECKRITIAEYWQTHGRGNTDRGRKHEVSLYTGGLDAGRTYEFPFEVELPAFPVTYHGHYINVDHYLHVQVHVAWAFDPKTIMDIVITPGGQGRSDAPPTRPGAALMTAHRGGLNKVALIAGIVMLIAGVIFLFPCGLVLLPAGLLVILAAFKNIFAQWRIGKVEFIAAGHELSPGDPIDAELVINPRKPAKINGITTTLIGREEAVSGSGSNRTTHKHEFYRETFALLDRGQIAPNREIRLPIGVHIPLTAAYSFHASDNNIVWQLDTTIDIPRWPDWVHNAILAVIAKPGVTPPIVPRSRTSGESTVREVRPTTMADMIAAVRDSKMEPMASPDTQYVDAALDGELEQVEPFDAEPPLLDDDQPLATSNNFDEPSTTSSASEYPDPPQFAARGNDVSDLLPVIASLKSADAFSDDRANIIESHGSRNFDLVVEVDRVDWTFPSENMKRNKEGRTVIGKLIGESRHSPEIAVRFPEDLNEMVDALSRGAHVSVNSSIGEWNRFYDRIEMVAETEPTPLN